MKIMIGKEIGEMLLENKEHFLIPADRVAISSDKDRVFCYTSFRL